MWYMGLNENNIPIRWDNIPFENSIEVTDEVWNIHMQHPFYIWNGTALIEYIPPYIEPVPYVPEQITMRQARLQLIALGVYQQVNAAVEQMGETAQVEWEYAAVVEKNNPLVIAMGQLLGWSETQADEFFIAANKL